MIAKEINITHTGQILASFIIGLCLCLWTALNMKPAIGVAIGFIPFATLFIFICINKPAILLAITFMLNYLIMGINRYHSIPIAITNIFDLLYGIMLALILLKQLQSNHHFRRILNVYTCITLVWLLYCIINIGNGITGEFYMEAWLRILRPWALYPILTCIILSIHCNRYTFIHYFLILWGIMTLLAAAKGYWQKNKGFDSTELSWLWAYGARTHFIHSGIRYFSFSLTRVFSVPAWDYPALFSRLLFLYKEPISQTLLFNSGYGRILWSVNIGNPIGHSSTHCRAGALSVPV